MTKRKIEGFWTRRYTNQSEQTIDALYIEDIG